MNDYLRIGPGFEFVTCPKKRISQLLIVVYLAVENNPDRIVLILQLLVTCIEINNAQASMPQSNHLMDIISLIIRPAVSEDPAHTLDQNRIYTFSVPGRYLTTNTTHKITS